MSVYVDVWVVFFQITQNNVQLCLCCCKNTKKVYTYLEASAWWKASNRYGSCLLDENDDDSDDEHGYRFHTQRRFQQLFQSFSLLFSLTVCFCILLFLLASCCISFSFVASDGTQGKSLPFLYINSCRK